MLARDDRRRQLILHSFTVSGRHAGNFESAKDDIGQEPIKQPVLLHLNLNSNKRRANERKSESVFEAKPTKL